jgi:ethanolamine utilization protein EutN
MYLAKVVGTVVSTSKDESLIGYKLLVVKEIDEKYRELSKSAVAVDTVGAGVGEIVFVASGSSARSIFADKNPPIDCSIVGIIDSVEID